MTAELQGEALSAAVVAILGRLYRVCGYRDEGWFKILSGVGAFSEPHLEDLRRLIRPDFVCLDVGANLGTYTLALAQLAHTVLAFEPDRNAYAALQETMHGNDIRNVKTYPWVIGKENETGDFVEDSEWSSSSHFVPSARGGTIARSIDSFDLARLDFIKIDAEGSEIDILDGAVETLSRCRPLVMLEFNSFAFVHYRNIVPRAALDRIFGLFSKVGYYENGRVVPLADRELFLRNNMFKGFVDNLLCGLS